MRRVAGPVVRLAGRASEASVGPGLTERRLTVGQLGAAECDGAAGSSRQISAVRGGGTLSPSVVLAGVVQWRATLLPVRMAVRSVMKRGRCRDGGRAGPGLAQPDKDATRRVTASAVALRWAGWLGNFIGHRLAFWP